MHSRRRFASSTRDGNGQVLWSVAASVLLTGAVALATFTWSAAVAETDDAPLSDDRSPLQKIQDIPGLVALWDFAERAGEPRVSRGTEEAHALKEVGGPIERRKGGPLSGHAAYLNGEQYFTIAHDDTGDLNICGRDATVSMIAFFRLERMDRGVTIAGMWSEGRGAGDNSGVRQYALLLNMPLYGGARQVTPHVSATGGASRRADGTTLPWCVDYAATESKVELNKWVSIGFTYDGKWIRAYYNGRFERRELQPKEDRRTDRYFTREGPDGGDRGMNPYYQPDGIYCYDPEDEAKRDEGAPFTVGGRQALGKEVAETFKGSFGGLAVFNRALSDEQMLAIHEAVLPEGASPSESRGNE